jgi:soluble lytic murein transglycosylase-like protein/TolA-binding protein
MPPQIPSTTSSQGSGRPEGGRAHRGWQRRGAGATRWMMSSLLLGVGLLVSTSGGAAAPVAEGRTPDKSIEPYFVRGRFVSAATRFRQGDWNGAVAGFEAALVGTGDDAPEVRRARFLFGLALGNLSRWPEAAATFVEIWKRDDLLADHVAYQSARAFLRAGDAATAVTWSARVDESSVPAAEAALIGIDALVGQTRADDRNQADRNQADALLAATTKFLDRYPAGPRRHEAFFARGTALATLGRPIEAATAYRQAWAIAPSDAFAKRIDERLAALPGEGPSDPTLTSAIRKTAAEWLTRATLLADRNRHEAAEAAFMQALNAPALDPTIACRARFGFGNAVFKMRQRARAQTLYVAAEKSCAEAKDDDYLARAMYQRGRCLVLTGDLAGAGVVFDRLEVRFPGHRLADDARVRAAEVAADRGDVTLADELLGTVAARHPGGDMAEEAQWRLAFRAYQRRDYATARRILQPVSARAAADESTGAEATVSDRARYFEARSWEGEGNLAAAVKGYEATAREFPLSLYTLWALARLGEVAPGKQRALLAELRASSPSPSSSSSEAAGAAPAATALGEARAIELARMGLANEAQREAARVLRQLGEDPSSRRGPEVAGRVASALDRGGFWAISHGLAVGRLGADLRRYPASASGPRGSGPSVDAWRLAYPRAYPDVVVGSSTSNAVPVALQWALMRQESAFEPRAESSANCLGLTMLKLSTAEQRLGRKVTRDELFDPATNLAAGSKHLAALLRRYRGAVVPAIAAYNAGETVVGRWLTERGALAPDEFVEAIPYEETRNYVKRVLAAYFAYSWLYEAGTPVPQVTVQSTDAPG